MMNLLPLIFAMPYIASVACAPTSPSIPDYVVNAQILNFKFQHNSPKLSDSCNTGLVACIGGSFAQCTFGTWKTQPCSENTQCWAFPGTSSIKIQCVQDDFVDRMFEQYGVSPIADGTGDTEAALPTTVEPSTTPSVTRSATSSPTANNGYSSSVTSVPISTTATSKAANSTLLSDATTPTAISASVTPSSETANDGITTVTMTITVPFSSTALPTEVRTISPDEASSILSSAQTHTCKMGNTSVAASSSPTSPTSAISTSSESSTSMSSGTDSARATSSATSPPHSSDTASASAAVDPSTPPPASYYVYRRSARL